jgi:hypothetical protein
MTETLEFTKTYNYNTLKTGISVPVILQYGEDIIEVQAKLDTGASFCIFERKHGELLNLVIENGEPITIGTATGSFQAYGHELTLITFGLQWQATVYFIAEEGIKRNILGRTGWLDHVKLGLIEYEGKLFLSPYPENL